MSDKEMDIGKDIEEEQECVAISVSPITAENVQTDIKIGKSIFFSEL